MWPCAVRRDSRLSRGNGADESTDRHLRIAALALAAFGSAEQRLPEREPERRSATTPSCSASARSAPRANGAPPTRNSIKRRGRGGHPAQILRRAAEAGEPDQGAALVHRAAGRCHRVLARSSRRAGKPVLREAKTAKHSRVLTDRAVDVSDALAVRHASSARTSWKKAARPARWLLENTPDRKGDINIVELQGTVGSAPANDRKHGFQEVIATDPQFKIIRSQSGDFTRARGKEVMEAFLKAEGKTHQRALRAQRRHGDRRDSGYRRGGAEAGQGHRDHFHRRREGRVRSHDGRQAQRHRRVQPVARAAAHGGGEGCRRGQALPKRIVTEESIFPMETAREVFPTRKY